jgi:hypothetical protein
MEGVSGKITRLFADDPKSSKMVCYGGVVYMTGQVRLQDFCARWGCRCMSCNVGRFPFGSGGRKRLG